MAIKNSHFPIYLSLLSAFALFAALSIQQARADDDSAQPASSGATMADRLAAIEAQNRQILQALHTGGVADSCCNGDSCSACGSGCNCCRCYDPAWIVSADAIVWQRTPANSGTLLRNQITGAAMLDTSDLHFNFEPGERVSIARRFDTGCELEVNYFGIDGWQATAVPAAPGFPSLSIPTGAFIGFNVHPLVSYASRLHSLELNATMPCGSFWKLLIGFRGMELNESLVIQDAIVPSISYEADTINHLYGLQAGAVVTPVQSGRFRVDAGLKAGALENVADSRARYNGTNTTAIGQGNNLAFFGETSITAVYQATDHIGLRIGYQMAALDGVALAPYQIPTHIIVGANAGTGTTVFGGSVLYHGGFGGLELTW